MEQEYIVRTVTKGDKKLDVIYDPCPVDPRSWDNVGKMVLFHNRYHLPNELGINKEFVSSPDDLYDKIAKEYDAVLILTVYMMEHGSVGLSLSDYGDNWDSGFVGYIVATRDAIKENFGCQRVSKKMIRTTRRLLEGEVETYSSYLNGDVYGYRISTLKKCDLDKVHEDNIEAVYGFYRIEDIADEVPEFSEELR